MQDQNVSKGEQRRSRIMEALKAEGRLTVQELMDRFECSIATIRRDLEILEKGGTLIRTLGGAQYEGYSAIRELPFDEKRGLLWSEKQSIAMKAASLVEEGDVVGLTGGTTTFLIAKELKARRNVTVVTNAVNIAMELSDSEGVQVVLTGGVMRKNSFELCGPMAERTIPLLHITKMFMGVDGISMENGVTTYSDLEARIAELMMGKSAEVYAVFDHSKLGRSSLFTVGPVSSLTGCITDRPLPKDWESLLSENGISTYVV